MSEKHFRYYDDWKNEVLICPDCGWSGTFEQGMVYYHRDVMHTACPTCPYAEWNILAIVSFPTLEETEANFDRLSEFEKAVLASRKRFIAEHESRGLRSADQLPDLSASQISLSWDFTGEGDWEGSKQTVIRHGERIVWTEPAFWEGYGRFVEVVSILKAKYGERLVDVVPTEASELYLYGDCFSACGVVKQARSRIQE